MELEENYYDIDLGRNPKEYLSRIIDNIGDLDEGGRKLLEDYFLKTFCGEAELAIYNLDSFFEQAGDKAIKLQSAFIRNLDEESRLWLVERIPKGAKVKFEVEEYLGGVSPELQKEMEDLVKQHGLYVPEKGAELEDFLGLEPPTIMLSEEAASTLLDNLNRLSNKDAIELLNSVLQVGSKTHYTIFGTLVAEPIQGYGGIRLMDEEGKEISLSPSNIHDFCLTGVEMGDKAKRRPREIYPGRLIEVFVNGKWVKGVIEGRLFADQIRVELSGPYSEETILDFNRQLNFIDVWVGKPPDYNLGEVLPEIGSALIETHDYLFDGIISFDLEDKNKPIDKVPEVFRTGNLVLFPDGFICEIGRISSQGMVEIRNINSNHIKGWDRANWTTMDELPQPLTSEGIDEEIINGINKIRGARVRVRMSDLGIETDKNEYAIMRVHGAYNIKGLPYVFLQSLPVWIGRGGNNPGFIFKTIELKNFYSLLDESKIEMSNPDVTKELREQFPDRFKKILSFMNNDDGSVPCILELRDGRKSDGAVSLSSLPYGVWKVWEPMGEPELIPISEIKDIIPYDFWAILT